MEILKDILFVFAGVFFHMSFLHLFSFYETQYHPIIAKSKNPYLASKIWGVIQFVVGTLILVLCKYQLGRNIQTLMISIGFIFWALFMGLLAGKHFKK